MELTGADENDIARSDRTLFQIDRNNAPPLFNNDQLKLCVPVQRNLRKILRDGTEICIVWEFRCCVRFSLTIILVFVQIHVMPPS